MNKKVLLYIKIGVFIGTPILFLVLPKTYFDTGAPLSLFSRLGMEGHYSEGMTRAVMRIIHFDFQGAWEFNKISFIVFPVLLGIWAWSLLGFFKKLQKLSTDGKKD